MLLRELRDKKQKTQVEVAKELNITQEFLSQLETGKKKPSLEVTKRIAEYYGVSTDILVKEFFK